MAVNFAVMSQEDRKKYNFTQKMSDEAQHWIRQNGYWVWPSYGRATICVSSRAIIRVAAEGPALGDDQQREIDCICYAAVLLYRRLKRNGAIT